MLADMNAATLIAATIFSLTHASHNPKSVFADHEIRYTVPSPDLHHIPATRLLPPMPHYTSTRTIMRVVYTTIHLPGPHTEVGHPVHLIQPVPTHVAYYGLGQIPMESQEHVDALRQYREHQDLRRRGGIYDPPLPAYDVPTTTVTGPRATGEPCALGQSGCVAAPGAVSLVGDIVDGIKSMESATMTPKMTTGTRHVPAATSAAESAVRENTNAAEAMTGAEGISRVAFLVAVAAAVVGSGFA